MKSSPAVTAQQPRRGRDEAFVAALEERARDEDRAALAVLRRGLGRQPGEVAEMLPYVVRFLPVASGRREAAAYFLVASLFGLHPQNWRPADDQRRRSNLGASFARLAPHDAANRPAVERRFVALLNSHGDDLPAHLRHAVSLLKAAEIAIDYTALLRDVRGWDREDRVVQREWARAFWGDHASAQESGATTTPTAETETTDSTLSGESRVS